MTFKEFYEGTLGMVLIGAVAVWYFGGDDTSQAAVVSTTPEVVQQELTHAEQMEVQLDKAHEQYATALRQKDSGQRWFGSTHLPRVGSIRADDYRWCKDQSWNRNADEHDFCAWHASIGAWHK